MTKTTFTMHEPLYEYMLNNSLRDTDLHQRLRAETAQLPEARMQVSPEQGQFLALLVELIQAERILEIGTFTGYSALCMAQAQTDTGTIITCDLDQTWTSIGQRYWQEAGVAPRIDLRLGPALETLQSLINEGHHNGFDLAFIDADKANYPHYYETCLQLVKPGGLIAVDNVLWGGSVIDEADQTEDTQAIRSLNQMLHKDERVSVSMVPIADGLYLARKR